MICRSGGKKVLVSRLIADEVVMNVSERRSSLCGLYIRSVISVTSSALEVAQVSAISVEVAITFMTGLCFCFGFPPIPTNQDDCLTAPNKN